MNNFFSIKGLRIITIFSLAILHHLTYAQSILDLQLIGRYSTGVFDEGATEIAAYDSATQNLFSTNGFTGNVDVINISDPSNPQLITSIELNPIYGGGANSVATRNDGIVAMAVEAEYKQQDGKVVFADANGNIITSVTVGALPDMLIFTPDGTKLLVANEGEPNDDYTIDPLGSVSIIDVSNPIDQLTQGNVITLDFSAFINTDRDSSIRIFGPGATVAQDLEPEYITVNQNSTRAWVTLQENNAIATIDLTKNKITSLHGLGFKNHNQPGNGFDASDESTAINIAPHPVFGMYQPDGIAWRHIKDHNYLLMANEGDARDYDGYEEAERVSDLVLDSIAFPNAEYLQNDTVLGRLNVTTEMGDVDGDGDYDALYSFGARSFSIHNVDGTFVWDSGDDLEQITADAYPSYFNCSNTNNDLKDRSDDKGPEPEGITVARIQDSIFAFIGLERIGGIVVYNISDPQNPVFNQYVNTRDFTSEPEDSAAGDLGPEGLLFIPFFQSPNGRNLLVVSNEISGTVAIFETDIACPKNRVQVCYNNNVICIDSNNLQTALASGATMGGCGEGERTKNFPITTDFNLNIYPNPSAGDALLEFNNTSEGMLIVEIFNELGMKVAEFKEMSLGGNMIVPADGLSLPSGVYLIRSINNLNLSLSMLSIVR